MFAIQRGDLAGALDWSGQLSELSVDLFFQLQHVPPRLLIAQGEKAAAAEQLRRLCERATQAGAHGYTITIRVCQALAAATPTEALTFLAEALTKGKQEGYIRTFVDEGRLLEPLLRKALAQGVTPEYTSRLLKIIEAEERERKIKTGELPRQRTLAGDLSEREMEVLGLLAEGLSDRQIATKLMISLSTAKTHVHRILEKLDATSRTQAVTQARSIKLI
jgi:LuxR family maltose regulon positive regulatory protein